MMQPKTGEHKTVRRTSEEAAISNYITADCTMKFLGQIICPEPLQLCSALWLKKYKGFYFVILLLNLFVFFTFFWQQMSFKV